MKKRIRFAAWALVILLGSLTVYGANWFFLKKQNAIPWTPPPSISEVVDGVLAERSSDMVEEDSLVDFGADNEINVLVLGLDARKGVENPHCDAIHMFTLNVEDWTVEVTSVPRGTYTYIPPGTYPDNEYYLANACAFMGLDYGIEQIEKVAGKKADYYVTAGFSQVLGILRSFELPTTESLQWLRHRQSYAIGDPQRSHNQAVFMKDLMVNQMDRFRGEFSSTMLFVLYNFVDTDMDFKTAQALFEGFKEAEIDKRPDDIVLTMRPYYETVDYHLDLENPDEQINALIERLKPYLSADDLSLRSLESIQEELVSYIEDVLETEDREEIETVIDQQLWRQIEDEVLREDIHEAYMEWYASLLAEEDVDAAVDFISAYIMEMEAFQQEARVLHAKDLLSTMVLP